MVDEKSAPPVPTPAPAIHDRRVPPKGVLPRALQSWLMVGVAFVMVLIILLTGHAQPPTPARAGATPAAPALASPDRIKTYRDQLGHDENRLQGADRPDVASPTSTPRVARVGASSVARDEASREADSLFADNVALSRRPAGQQPYAERHLNRPLPSPGPAPAEMATGLEQIEQALTRVVAQGPPVLPRRDAAPTPAVIPVVTSGEAPTLRPSVRPSDAAASRSPEHPAPGPRLILAEATIIETVLLTRLDGTLAGPVSCLVTTPVYSRDRQTVLIPAGARVLGAAAPVQAWGDSRLAVSFHRLLMPDGHSYSLDLFKGLDQAGEMGIREDVNRHYWQVFGASIAIGALSGLAQYGTRGGIGVGSFGDESRQAAGASLASSTSRVLDRYLNILPTITVREGHRIKVSLTNDFALPAYGAAPGGLR